MKNKRKNGFLRASTLWTAIFLVTAPLILGSISGCGGSSSSSSTGTTTGSGSGTSGSGTEVSSVTVQNQAAEAIPSADALTLTTTIPAN